MRIGIDARFFGGSIGKGIGRYSQKLIENLEDIDRENNYFIFLSQENFSLYKPENPKFTKIFSPYPWYSIKEQLAFPRQLKKLNLDLVHFLHFNVPLLYGGKFVMTIHDLIHHLPGRQGSNRNFFIYGIKKFAYKIVTSSAIKRARKVLTVSNFSKEQIIKLTNCPSEKIKVIYEAADPPQKGSLGENKDLAFLKNFLYLLYVGNAFPHKNLVRLLQAFKMVYSSLDQPKLSLVLVGAPDPFFRKLERLSKRIGISHHVIFTGRVSDEELAWLYQHALAYVFPSLIEGFGLPGLEAMSYGLPVVASNRGPLPEVYEQAALYFDPEDIIDMSKKISRIVQDQDLRQQLSSKGKEQVKKFSWQKMARETLGVYKSV